MNENIKKTIVVGVISWTTAFITVRKIFPKRSFDFSNRIISTIHAILAVTFASLSVQDWSCPICPVAAKSSYQQMQVLAVSLSYLIYDLVCCFFDERVNMENTIHHLVSIVGLGAGLYYQKCGSEIVATTWITEMSSPFLHLREMLKELGYRDTPINLAADSEARSRYCNCAILAHWISNARIEFSRYYNCTLFATIFAFARMVIGPCITYVTLSSNNPFLIKAMGLGLQLVSAFWFFKIVRMMKYKLTKKSTSKNGIMHANITKKTTTSQFQHNS